MAKFKIIKTEHRRFRLVAAVIIITAVVFIPFKYLVISFLIDILPVMVRLNNHDCNGSRGALLSVQLRARCNLPAFRVLACTIHNVQALRIEIFGAGLQKGQG